MKLFYCWQSDLPNNTNRGFIEKALSGAARALKNDSILQIEAVVDRDVLDTPGAANIADTILSKIESSDVFIADVSIIGEAQGRKTPNPNVVFELGYACHTLGASRILLIMNLAYGEPEELPFDLRMKSVITYRCDATAPEKATERGSLQKKLSKALETIIKHAPARDDVAQFGSHDKELFQKFLLALPSNRAIAFVRENNFAGFSFNWNSLSVFDEFSFNWNDAEHKFINKEMEELRSKLHAAISEFLDTLSVQSFPIGSTGRSSIPPEWELDQPERFERVVTSVHKLAKTIVELHQALVKKGLVLTNNT